MLSRNVRESWSCNWSLWGHYQQSLPTAVFEQIIGGCHYRQAFIFLLSTTTMAKWATNFSSRWWAQHQEMVAWQSRLVWLRWYWLFSLLSWQSTKRSLLLSDFRSFYCHYWWRVVRDTRLSWNKFSFCSFSYSVSWPWKPWSPLAMCYTTSTSRKPVKH